MTETRDITLGGRVFAVPPLPLRINRVVYPICRKLVMSNLFERVIAANGIIESDEDFEDLSEIAFNMALAAEPELAKETFLELPISPTQLLDAFFNARYQTGGWVEVAAAAGETAEGEAPGAESPQT